MYFDKDFTHVKDIDLPSDLQVVLSNGVINIDGDYFIIGTWCIDRDGNYKDIQQFNIIGVTENIVIVSNYVLPKTYIGSRCLLDAPITKTDKQTMKITYDFKLPSIF